HHSTVTLSLQTIQDLNPFAATLNGDKTATVTNGIATFDNLTIEQAGTYQLHAEDSILSVSTAINSSQFVIKPAAVSQFLFANPKFNSALPVSSNNQPFIEQDLSSAGKVYQFTVVAADQFKNTVTTFSSADTLTFESAGRPSPDVMPTESPYFELPHLANGTGTFHATLNLAGDNFIKVTDGSITGILQVSVNGAKTELIVTTA